MIPIVDSGQTNFFANGSQYSEGAVYVRGKDDADIGRGFAESVEDADTAGAMFSIASIDDVRVQRLIRETSSSWPRRFWSLLYVFTHRSQLNAVLASQKGLSFLRKAKPFPNTHAAALITREQNTESARLRSKLERG